METGPTRQQARGSLRAFPGGHRTHFPVPSSQAAQRPQALILPPVSARLHPASNFPSVLTVFHDTK